MQGERNLGVNDWRYIASTLNRNCAPSLMSGSFEVWDKRIKIEYRGLRNCNALNDILQSKEVLIYFYFYLPGLVFASDIQGNSLKFME